MWIFFWTLSRIYLYIYDTSVTITYTFVYIYIYIIRQPGSIIIWIQDSSRLWEDPKSGTPNSGLQNSYGTCRL